ncbi:MAG: HDOD domain-containing protein [Planctomycetota bacterium]|nr:HDOD domain-containing protein [Planctomycetota bacterium]
MSGTFEELRRTGRLPSPSGVGARILALTQAEDSTVDDIADALVHDPALTGRILRIANSAVSAGTMPMTTAKAAAMRLGMKAVSSIAVGFTVVSAHRRGYCEEFDYEGFWSISMATAAAGQELARRILPESTAEAFTAGLVMGIGRLGLASVQPVVYGSVLSTWRGDLAELRALEREHLKIDHAELTGLLLGDWGIPAHVADAVRSAMTDLGDLPPGPSRQLADILTLATHLAHHHIGLPDQDLAADPIVASHLEHLHLGIEALEEILSAAETEWRSLALDLELRPLPPTEVTGIEGDSARPEEVEAPLVLVVDDDPISLKLITNCVGRAGYRVAATENPLDAMALAIQHEPAVLITDWVMPELSGLELCRALRRCEVGRRLYIMVLTGREEEDACKQAFDAEADDFIRKPFNPRDMVDRIQVGVRLAEAQDALACAREEPEAKACGTSDIDDISGSDRALGEESGRDLVTGLPNRVFATSRLAVLFERARHDETSLAVIAVTIDPAAGDLGNPLLGNELSKQVAEVAKPCLRKKDPFCCTSPGRFLILCPDADLLEAATIAERLRGTIEAADLTIGDKTGAVTISAGVAELAAATATPAALLQLAEMALELGAMDGANAVHAAA